MSTYDVVWHDESPSHFSKMGDWQTTVEKSPDCYHFLLLSWLTAAWKKISCHAKYALHFVKRSPPTTSFSKCWALGLVLNLIHSGGQPTRVGNQFKKINSKLFLNEIIQINMVFFAKGILNFLSRLQLWREVPKNDCTLAINWSLR